jgi:hypothetical protein
LLLERMVKISSCLLAFLVAAPLAAQEVPREDVPVEEVPIEDAWIAEPPPNLASEEMARSRSCVPRLAQLAAVASELDPLRQRAERIEALHGAVSLEDSLRVSPLAEDVPLEQAVRDWFTADEALAREYVTTQEEAVVERRRELRDAMLERLREAFEEVDREAGEILASAEGVDTAVRVCEGRIFVRSAVLEACENGASPICEAARSGDPSSRFRFVEDPLDLWDIEQLRPWTDPSRLRPTPEGGLGGARTNTLARRGNISLVVSLEPLIQPRAALSEEQAEEFRANLEALGFEFEHPDFVMAPAMSFELDVPGRLGDETHYLLHLGDLSEPEADILWAVPAGEDGPVGAFFAVGEAQLVRLAQGEQVSVTAVRVPDSEDQDSEPIFTLGVTPVGQAGTVTALLSYMAGGELAADLAALVPPGDPDAP